ncbi:peptide/nickel transport system ATP-binding protein [Pseudochelatococcus lubricantis]|uniref:Peptide/nickel transport system ATP-binding protein n=1 Tax=Pseudochelatococcus lubricantis TaxID=1538102 RepID=A0ABX0V3C3_9HYPH|nr:ABC transporter ATP-binding protein [Pseudochelatococcus lubricantis]NIJ58850.1 peptide/nickel transport system ATP-binding protein [Pseudochelatococcus lubricantis]
MEPTLSIERLTIDLPEGADRPHAIRDVSLALYPGRTLCIVGESGSGKSMSANAVMGLLPRGVTVGAGRILFQGRDITGLTEAQFQALRGAGIAMIFQEPMTALNPLMRIGAQIAEVFEAHGQLTPSARGERALQLLREVGIPDPERAQHAYPFQLSGGQRQRVVIAMALALEPKVLIADEPTTALDVTTQAQILKLIKELQVRHGMAVMFVTHDFGVVAEIADDVAVIELGELVEQGPASKVLVNPDHPYTRRLIDAIPKVEFHPSGTREVPLLRVRNLVKAFHIGERVVKASDDVSIDVMRGETLGIVGESGSGKSTLGRAIVQLMQPDSGTIEMDGKDISHLRGAALKAHRKRIQMIFQDPYASLNPRARIGRILTEGQMAHGVKREAAQARARELLKLVGLRESAMDRFPHEFSGGQRQRIGIARALALEPEVVVADEAVSALDVSVQAQVLDLLEDLKQRLGLTMIFITHDLRVAGKICDRIVVMQKGRIVEIGRVEQVFLSPRAEYTRNLLEAAPGLELEGLA